MTSVAVRDGDVAGGAPRDARPTPVQDRHGHDAGTAAAPVTRR